LREQVKDAADAGRQNDQVRVTGGIRDALASFVDGTGSQRSGQDLGPV
jgi:uncharacterized protein YajQ (UPF0234 family)